MQNICAHKEKEVRNTLKISVALTDVPEGWAQIIRSPRPPSAWAITEVGSQRFSRVRFQGVSSCQVQCGGERLEGRLEAALSKDLCRRSRWMQESSRTARQRSKVVSTTSIRIGAPLGERLDSWQRVKGRCPRAEARIREAQDDKCLAEVPQRDPNKEIQRLTVHGANLKAKNCHTIAWFVSSFCRPCCCAMRSRSIRIRAELAEVRQERDLLRVGQITEPVDVQTASCRVEALIDAGDAKRRCIGSTLQ